MGIFLVLCTLEIHFGAGSAGKVGALSFFTLKKRERQELSVMQLNNTYAVRSAASLTPIFSSSFARRRGRALSILRFLGAPEVLGCGDAEELLQKDLGVENGDVGRTADEVVGRALHLMVNVISDHGGAATFDELLQDISHHLHVDCT